jgi:hypothetical protein
MRRGLPLFLIALLGLWPLAGLTAASDESRLPPCCRRHGAHHCAMAMAARARLRPTAVPLLEAPATCPNYPRTMNGASAPTVALATAAIRWATAPLTEAALPTGSVVAVQGQILLPVGRGPPEIFPVDPAIGY